MSDSCSQKHPDTDTDAAIERDMTSCHWYAQTRAELVLARDAAATPDIRRMAIAAIAALDAVERRCNWILMI